MKVFPFWLLKTRWDQQMNPRPWHTHCWTTSQFCLKWSCLAPNNRDTWRLPTKRRRAQQQEVFEGRNVRQKTSWNPQCLKWKIRWARLPGLHPRRPERWREMSWWQMWKRRITGESVTLVRSEFMLSQGSRTTTPFMREEYQRGILLVPHARCGRSSQMALWRTARLF